ncbi:MAG: hypothetical protein MN733_12115, partial [Nitrososphaera sp.]|nr:hypothetical protein [Nitrososphaera sp.]
GEVARFFEYHNSVGTIADQHNLTSLQPMSPQFFPLQRFHLHRQEESTTGNAGITGTANRLHPSDPRVPRG